MKKESRAETVLPQEWTESISERVVRNRLTAKEAFNLSHPFLKEDALECVYRDIHAAARRRKSFISLSEIRVIRTGCLKFDAGKPEAEWPDLVRSVVDVLRSEGYVCTSGPDSKVISRNVLYISWEDAHE